MFTKTSSNSAFRLEMQGRATGTPNTYRVFTASECAIGLTRLDQEKLSLYWIMYEGNVGGVLTTLGRSATYTSDPSGCLSIPLRRPLRDYAKRTDDGKVRLTVYLNETSGTAVDSVDFIAAPVPGIDNYELPMPYGKDAKDLGVSPRSFILPPNVIIAPPVGVKVIVESDAADYNNCSWKDINGNAIITPTGPRGNELEYTGTNQAMGIRLEQLTRSMTYNFTPIGCDNAVLVRWTSLTGATRQHLFPVLSQTRSSEDLGLLTPGDGIRTERNTVIGVRCRLSGLTAYGYWYYMDLLTANDVHAVPLNIEYNAPDVNALIESDLSAATVKGGSAEVPVGGSFHNFDFTINLRHYDTH